MAPNLWDWRCRSQAKAGADAVVAADAAAVRLLPNSNRS